MIPGGWDWLISRPEGQFLERKSCWDRSTERRKRLDARKVAATVAETLAAMANADGGTLVLGIDNDGSVTGIDYPADRLSVIRGAPASLVRPPIEATMTEVEIDGVPVLVFETEWSADVHQLHDGRYMLRVGDQSLPFPASDIEAMKESRRKRATEVRVVPSATMADIDANLVQRFATKADLGMSPADVLVRYRLAEPRGRSMALTLAALLLFGRDPGRWHPRCGVDFVKYEGSERRVGSELNIVKRERVEAPLLDLPERVFNAVMPHVRERQRLVDLFFEERFEYPSFAWQEAIVNAVGHRDYGYEGMQIEIWMFDDRIEVRSPGAPVEPVTVARLARRERLHATRNPRMVRVLSDYGLMREQGEGVPRMFDVMEREGLAPPSFSVEADVVFLVTLRNTPVYSAETARWISRLPVQELSSNQKRVLAYAREHGDSFTSRAYQRLVGVDLYTASRDIRQLIRHGLVRLNRNGGRVYSVAPPESHEPRGVPEALQSVLPRCSASGHLRTADIADALQVPIRYARRLVAQWVDEGWLEPQGEKRGRRYLWRGGHIDRPE